jgi:hypothetical protein
MKRGISPYIDLTTEKCYSNLMANTSLNKASKLKFDEFYTQISDIERELKHYPHHFKNKTVFCNCDDPYESNFFKYFALKFTSLGLKRLIATCYAGSPIANKQLSLFDHESEEHKTTRMPHKIIINEAEDENTDRSFSLQDIVASLVKNEKNTLTRLNGDGDFRSQECIEILKETDIVVTNPPFSLINEYIAQLVEYEKKFIIIGSKNAITYKEIFKLIKDNKIWLGYGFANGNAYFSVVTPRDFADGVYDPKTGLVKFRNVGWFTNLDFKARHDDLMLYRTYKGNEKDYPKYDNYDAINVDKVKDIPIDYDGVMGVPITFLDDYNPDQFEIIGNLGCYAPDGYSLVDAIYIKGKKLFKRIAIKRK